MTFLAKFTNTNPRARLNFSWERSARRLLEIARHQYQDAYEEAELPPRGQFAEQALVALLMKDPSFKKLADAVKDGHAWFDEIEAILNDDESTDKKAEKDKAAKAAVPAKAFATAPVSVAAVSAPAAQPVPVASPAQLSVKPAWPNN